MSDPMRVRRRGRTTPETAVTVDLITVTDDRINGNAFRLLTMLKMLSEMETPPTQTEVAKHLGLGGTAFRQAKLQLRAAGYLIEVRDRYPKGHREQRFDKNTGEMVWKSRAGQNRYSYWLQDPLENGFVPEEESLIVADHPVDLIEETPDQNRSTKREAVSETGLRNVKRQEKPQVSTGLQNVNRYETALRNVKPLKETQVGWLVGRLNISSEPTDLPDQVTGAREPEPASDAHGRFAPHDDAEIDAELAKLHPALKLTLAEIRRQVDGRVDLNQIDVVQAVADTVVRASLRGTVVENPAAYVAPVLVRKPEAWPRGAARPTPLTPTGSQPERNPDGEGTNASYVLTERERDAAERAACARGEHDWGPEVWGELSRAYCVRAHCNQTRRDVDPAFAELESDLMIGGTK